MWVRSNVQSAMLVLTVSKWKGRRCPSDEPEFGGWDMRGKDWIIEGHGVDPDIELDLDADGLIHGHDVQLDKAIDYLLAEIAQDPRELPAKPPIRPRPLIPVP